MHVMLLALVLLGFNCFHIHVSTLCVVSLAKVTIYMIYIEPLFLIGLQKNVLNTMNWYVK